MGEAISRTLPAQVHGRYLVQAPRGPGPHPLMVGFHGYGEAAEQHLDQLRRLPGAEGFVLAAVQSLHLFYNRRDGEVVGSWMTRQGREEAIADNVLYVAEVVQRVGREFATDGTLVYAGFSQGAAMAYRAAARAGHACHGLLVLGGDMPPDVAEGSGRLPPVLVGRGARDEWFTAEKLRRDLDCLEQRGVHARSVVFEGGHEWTEAFLGAAGEFLREITRASPAAP